MDENGVISTINAMQIKYHGSHTFTSSSTSIMNPPSSTIASEQSSNLNSSLIGGTDNNNYSMKLSSYQISTLYSIKIIFDSKNVQFIFTYKHFTIH